MASVIDRRKYAITMMCSDYDLHWCSHQIIALKMNSNGIDWLNLSKGRDHKLS